jgi:hypothetical protein
VGTLALSADGANASLWTTDALSIESAVARGQTSRAGSSPAFEAIDVGETPHDRVRSGEIVVIASFTFFTAYSFSRLGVVESPESMGPGACERRLGLLRIPRGPESGLASRPARPFAESADLLTSIARLMMSVSIFAGLARSLDANM